MRLLIDSVLFSSPGSLYLRDELGWSLSECAPEDWDVVLLKPHDHCESGGSDKLRVITMNRPGRRWIDRWNWYQSVLPQITGEHAANVLYSLSGILSKKLCRSLGTITTVNNMIPFTPERYRQDLLFSRAWIHNTLLRYAYVASMKRADAVVIHSRHALNTVKPYTGKNILAKTFVVLTGIPRDFHLNQSNPPPHPYDGMPYFLLFSSMEPYRNHLNLIKAYHCALDSKKELPHLLLAGMCSNKSYLKKILTTIKETGLEEKVKYIGILDRKDIPIWLYYADINFFPSTCETNSVVLAEILSVGGALACSGIPPMTEVAGNAAEFFDPYSVDSMANVMINLFGNRKRCAELRRLAIQRAQELSWETCGKAIWQAAIKAEAAFRKRRKTQ